MPVSIKTRRSFTCDENKSLFMLELDIRVDGLDSSNLQTQITTNTNDISSLQTSKQNTLIAGDNITITGETISSSGGGSGTTIDSTTDISCNTVTTVSDISCGGVISASNQISFRATYGPTGLKVINSSILLPFDQITYNIGGAYNSSKYTFTAPRSGTYFFNVDFFSRLDNPFGADFLVNDDGTDLTKLLRLEQPNTGAGGQKYVPASFITRLNVGDVLNMKRSSGLIALARNFTNWGGHFLC